MVSKQTVALGLWLWVSLLVAACQKAALTYLPSVEKEIISSSTPSALPARPTLTVTALVRIEVKAMATITPVPENRFCSPLVGYSLEQLPELVSNPFNPPAPGSDNPHHGVDLADRLADSQVAVGGRAVTSVLDGRVAAVIRDRFPYGNALLIESELGLLPEKWANHFQLATPAPTILPDPALTCPVVIRQNWDLSHRSLYILYAHLQDSPSFSLGDRVICGQILGIIGESGNALNPHLHLEARLGPAGSRFDSMAHYDNSATLEEMDAYCTWRVRGIFQVVDPLQLLTASP